MSYDPHRMRRLLGRPLGWLWLLLSLPLWLPRLLLPRRANLVHVEVSSPMPELGRVTGIERFVRKSKFGLWDLYELQRALSGDRRVRAVHLEFRAGISDGLATLQTAAEMLAAIRASGKKVLVTAHEMDNRLLWLAAGADAIALPPAATVFIPGHAAEIPFLGALLERHGLRAEVVKSGDFKTAGDTLSRSEMSPAHREMMEALLGDLQSQFVSRVAEGRKLPVEKVAGCVDRGLLTAEAARDAGLVDAVLYPDEVDDWLEEQVGAKVRRAGVWAYLGRIRLVRKVRRLLLGPARRLAVLDLSGVILHESPGRMPAREWVSAGVLEDAFESIRETRSIEAVILRVNSPGGSGAESELLWREVVRLVEEKPVVASMGDVAASGGYYLAAPASRIVALPGTLTGSIGVLAGKLDASGGLERIGIRVERVGRSEAAGFFSPAHPFSPRQRELMEEEVERFYQLFLERVAAGRKMETAEVHAVAQGRVWTGRQALERRLADSNGGLLEAIRSARELARIPAETPIEIAYFRPATQIGLARYLSRRATIAPAALLAALLRRPEPLAWWPDGTRIV